MSSHDPDWIVEGQWITGKTSKASESLSQVTGKPACQYGGVNTAYFYEGPKAHPQMYSRQGTLHFPCDIAPGKRTYQGLVSYNTVNKFFYAIDPDTGRIQVCSGIPINFEYTTSLKELTKRCLTATKSGLVLKKNEYFSAVGVLGTGPSNLTVVNIKNKEDDFALRQVAVSFFAAADLPTLDTETYFYSVAEATIWRAKKTFSKGQYAEAGYIRISSVSQKEEEVAIEAEKGVDEDRSVGIGKGVEKRAVIF